MTAARMRAENTCDQRGQRQPPAGRVPTMEPTQTCDVPTAMGHKEPWFSHVASDGHAALSVAPDHLAKPRDVV